MPLTFAHPAAILPFSYLPKRWFSLTGLIIGSIVPDFEYFIRMKVLSVYSHTLPGLFWFDLPLGLILCYVYHYVVRNAFIENLPAVIYKRLVAFKTLNWNKYFKQNWPVVVISVLIGTASHLFWDSFTHLNGHFVIAWGMSRVVSVSGLYLPLYKLIQHLSTLAGGIVVLIAIFRLPASFAEKRKSIYPYWIMVSVVAMMVVILRIVTGLNIAQYPHLIVTALSGYIAGIMLVPLLSGRVKR
ncbi:DUF4184 family protein [Mucilaginibacter sp. AW1-3]